MTAGRADPAPRGALPALGDWNGPIHGALGVLETDGERVCCHACGLWFKALAQHVRRTHLLMPEEYRAIFGLNASTALDAPALRATKRRNSAPVLARYRPLNQHVVKQQTTEERRAYASGPRRLQTRIDPHNREVWLRLQRTGAERARGLWQDPAYAEARARQMVEARGRRVTVPCAVCAAPIPLARWQVVDHQHHACSDACRRELHRRLLAQRGYLASAEARDKARTTRQRTLTARPEYGREVGAKISDAKRRRDEEVSEQLRQLPVAAWNAIPEPDRSMVRRYYGLDGARPATLADLMATFGLQHRHVRRMVAQGTLRLIDPDAAGAATPHEERVRNKTAVQARLAALPEGALARLAEVDRQIIVRFYGLDGGPPGRQRAIARNLGVSRKQVNAALAQAAALAERG